jgi:hypothetical protein
MCVQDRKHGSNQVLIYFNQNNKYNTVHNVKRVDDKIANAIPKFENGEIIMAARSVCQNFTLRLSL